MPPQTAILTRTPAAAGKTHPVQHPLEPTAGATLRPRTITTHPVDPAGDHPHSVDSPAEAVAGGNRAPQALVDGAAAVVAEAGVVAASAAEAGVAVEVSVAEDEDRFRVA